MAGDWIKIETTTPDKPEVFAMADTLGIDSDAVVGKLLRVWIWADLQTRDGRASVSRSDRDISVTVSLLDRVSGTPGFADAMLQCGWLERSEDGLRFANFDRHNGNPAKARATALRRKQRERARVSRPERDNSETREEERVESNHLSSTGVDGAKSGDSKQQTRPLIRTYSSEFIDWWTHYPRKVGKPTAAKAFAPAIKRIMAERSIERAAAIKWLTNRTNAYSRSVGDSDPKHIKHPGPWLNDDRFNDELNAGRTDAAQQPRAVRRRRAAV